jgi:hypothetical protein
MPPSEKRIILEEALEVGVAIFAVMGETQRHFGQASATHDRPKTSGAAIQDDRFIPKFPT